MDKIASNRNFVNKIWNAAKYVFHCLSQYEQDHAKDNDSSGDTTSSSSDLRFSRSQCAEILFSKPVSELPLAEQWILGKLATMVKEINQALSERSNRYVCLLSLTAS